jgi:RNA polymerase-binding transcription factor DksA
MPTPDRPHPDLVATLPVLRASLEEHRQFRLDQLAGLAVSVTLGRAASDVARDEISMALASAARQALANTEAALDRMDAGEYGTCLRCHAAIPLEHLRIVPQTAHCTDCQR